MTDWNDPNLVLSPLADPVVNAMCASVEVAGLAMESLISLTLKEDKQKLNGKVTSVIPQRAYTATRSRSCRVDIENDTDANEKIIAAVQINPDPNIMIRNIFEASHIFMDSSKRGTTHAQLAARMPRVIFINLLSYKLRKGGSGLIQPYKVMYTNNPAEVAIPNFSGYNIELPYVLEIAPDFSNGLFCWAYTLYKAHVEKKTIQEVLAMTPELLDYADTDAGFQQLSDRYEFVSADAQIRQDYVQWVKTMMQEEGERRWVYDEGVSDTATKIATNMLKIGRPVDEVVQVTGLTLEDVEEIKNKIEQEAALV